jgi:hypothetical protein
MQESRPLGYWLKHLDHLIEQAFERTLAAHSLTRRHWQVLHTIAAAPPSTAALEEELGLFLRDNRGGLTAVAERPRPPRLGRPYRRRPHSSDAGRPPGAQDGAATSRGDPPRG